jgi:uncharacterized protein YlxW (UPF0749 family)
MSDSSADQDAVTMAANDAPVEPEGTSARVLLARLAYQPSRPHLMIGALFLVLGLLVTVVVITPRGDEAEWRSARTEDLVQVLDDLGARQGRLEQDAARLAEVQRDLESGSTAQALADARRQLEALRVMSGSTPVSGPGVRITVDDEDGLLEAAVMIDAVQELRDAGAEAIEVSGVRVSVDTWFADTVEGVVVNGTPVGRNIEILAIGDPDTMTAAVSIPGGLAESVRTRGAEFGITSDDNLTISVTVPVRDP